MGKIVRHVRIDGQTYRKLDDGTLKPVEIKIDAAARARLNAMTDEDIDRAIADDPDASPIWTDEMFAEATRGGPLRKGYVHIGIDQDVLNFFKKDGKGYQTRINKVLRAFMEHDRKVG